MELNIYGWNILKKHLPDISFPKDTLLNTLKKEFSSFKIDTLNIVFTSKDHIKKLNREFRKKNSGTDVLSFLINEKPLEGEVYICLECIPENNEKEVLRLVVHGFLHIVGYHHDRYFDEDSKEKEEMFVIQEEILENIYRTLKKK